MQPVDEKTRVIVPAALLVVGPAGPSNARRASRVKSLRFRQPHPVLLTTGLLLTVRGRAEVHRNRDAVMATLYEWHVLAMAGAGSCC